MTQSIPTASMSGQLTSANALQYILGGNATFTFVDTTNQIRFTYKVQAIHGKLQEPIRFVKLMTGSDNEDSFTYFAYIKLQTAGVPFMYFFGKKSRIAKSCNGVSMFEYVIAHLRRGTIPHGFTIFHEGHCCKCGRKLTVPESVGDGIGPECKKYFIANKINY